MTISLTTWPEEQRIFKTYRPPYTILKRVINTTTEIQLLK